MNCDILFSYGHREENISLTDNRPFLGAMRLKAAFLFALRRSVLVSTR